MYNAQCPLSVAQLLRRLAGGQHINSNNIMTSTTINELLHMLSVEMIPVSRGHDLAMRNI